MCSILCIYVYRSSSLLQYMCKFIAYTSLVYYINTYAIRLNADVTVNCVFIHVCTRG